MEALGQGLGIDLHDHRHALAKHGGVERGDCVADPAAGVAKGDGGICHRFDIRTAPSLGKADRGGADRGCDDDLTLAQVPIAVLKLLDRLVARRAGQIDVADFYARQDAVVVRAGEGKGDDHEEREHTDDAQREGQNEPGSVKIARLGPGASERVPRSGEAALGLRRRGDGILRKLGLGRASVRVRGRRGTGRRGGLGLLLGLERLERIRRHLCFLTCAPFGNRRDPSLMA